MNGAVTCPVLEVVDLTRAFGGLVAVNELNFRIESGEIFGLLGPNGSGKTTALNLMSGVLRPDGGTIRLDGGDITGLPSYKIARLGLARTFQLVRVLDGMDCRENVLAGLAFHKLHLTASEADARAAALLERVGLAGFAHKPAADLTYIDRKRLELARALASKPKLLLLDEWLAGLNPSELTIGIDLIRSLKADGVTILLVEHVMNAVRALCDRCAVMSSGCKIAEGATEDVLADRHVIEAYLGGVAADA
jgi:branched-chain amino acid transport system ATP-binding protein